MSASSVRPGAPSASAGAALYQVDGSSLRSEHLFFDQADFLAQLGLQ